MTDSTSPNAVILLSGGLDSATTGAIARDQGFILHALSFQYGQRCSVELDAAAQVAEHLGCIEHRIVPIDLGSFGGSALTDDDLAIPKDQPQDNPADDIPITYVPARNTIFLSYALAYAETRSIHDIFIGANAVDYSGYPDCRPAYIEAFQMLANLATKMGVEGTAIGGVKEGGAEGGAEGGIRIHAPLIDLTKAQIIQRGLDLGVDYGLTMSCYDPAQSGQPCGRCDSCLLRAAGFRATGTEDPAL